MCCALARDAREQRSDGLTCPPSRRPPIRSSRDRAVGTLGGTLGVMPTFEPAVQSRRVALLCAGLLLAGCTIYTSVAPRKTAFALVMRGTDA